MANIPIYLDITSDSNTFTDGVTNGSEIDVITKDSGGVFQRYDLLTGAQLGTDVSLEAAKVAQGVTLITAASACVVYGNSTNADLIEVATGYRQAYAGGANTALTTSTFKGQQIAGDPTTGIAFASNNTSGSITKISGITFAATQPTPIALAGAKALTVCVKEGGNAWLLGTNNGLVIEIDSSGTSVKTITLPTTPNTGSAPTLLVTGLSMYGDTLVVTTGHGILYVYQYSTSTLYYQKMILPAHNAGSSGSVMCESASGYTMYSSTNGVTGTNFVQSANSSTVINISQLPPLEEAIFTTNTLTSTTAVGIAPDVNKCWMIYTGTGPAIRVFNLTTKSTTVQTRIQDSDVDIAGRIIRVRDCGIGRSVVESDQNISAAATDIAAIQGHEYIEIAIASGKADVRKFSS